jgi:histidinol-phosphate aminotransferase
VGRDGERKEAMHGGPRARTNLRAEGAPRVSVHVEGLAPYDAVSSLTAIGALDRSIVPLKLDWNESSIPPSPKVIDAVVAFLGNSHHLNWYPDLGARKLKAALSTYTGLDQECLLVTNGSDDALDLLCRTYLDATDDVLVAAPTYGHFLVFARARGVEPRLVTAATPFEVPTAALAAEVTPRTKLVYLASPNNPTGVLTPPEDVAGLCSRFPGTLFLVDEAYHEFCGVTCAPLVREFRNLVVTRTFSKCFGIAGLRVGYLMADSAVHASLCKLYNPKSVNVLGQVGALAALSDTAFREGYIREVREAREWLAAELAARGARVRSTAANFVLVRVARPRDLVASLEKVGVFVRDRSHIKGFDGFVRITVGTVPQMHDLVGRIDRLLAGQPCLLDPAD